MSKKRNYRVHRKRSTCKKIKARNMVDGQHGVIVSGFEGDGAEVIGSLVTAEAGDLLSLFDGTDGWSFRHLMPEKNEVRLLGTGDTIEIL